MYMFTYAVEIDGTINALIHMWSPHRLTNIFVIGDMSWVQQGWKQLWSSFPNWLPKSRSPKLRPFSTNTASCTPAGKLENRKTHFNPPSCWSCSQGTTCHKSRDGSMSCFWIVHRFTTMASRELWDFVEQQYVLSLISCVIFFTPL